METAQPENCGSTGLGEHEVLETSEIRVRAQLKRILSSAEFSVPERLRRFLIYVIDETLAGRPHRIKAYSIAVEVFGRDANLETQNDPVVRIEAGRLRRALERYYLLAGSSDPILIDMPKGGYVPRFLKRGGDWEGIPQTEPAGKPSFGKFIDAGLRHAGIAATAIALVLIAIVALVRMETPLPPVASAEATVRSDGPALSVTPFLNLTGTPVGDSYVTGLGEELLVQFARFKELTVFGQETPAAQSPGTSVAEIGNRFSSRYVLAGSVRSAESRLRITTRLLDGETSAIIWSASYDLESGAIDSLDMQRTIASRIATAVAQPYGIIFNGAPRPRSARGEQNIEAYRCTFRFYRYRAELDKSGHAETRKCLEQMTVRYPDHSTGWAMLSYLYLDEDRFQLNRRPGLPEPMERARAAAERAVRIDSENIRALQAMMAVLFYDKQPGEALQVGSHALALNPNDTELLGEFGSRVAQAGDWPRGTALLEQSMTKNPGQSGYYTGALALAYYMQGDDARAAEFVRRANLRHFPLYHFVAALIFARLGLEAETARYRTNFLKMRPSFFDDFEGELNKRNFNARDRAILRQGAILAGFPAPLSSAGGVE